MPEPITAKERAEEFVNKYSNMFTEDKDWWIAAIGLLVLEAQEDQLKFDKAMVLNVIGKVRS